MSYKDLITERGIIDLQGSYISIFNLKNKIEKSFNTKPISETSNSFSCKMIRFARLFGAPMFFSRPILNVELIREGGNTKIQCELIVFDYFMVYISIIILGFVLFFSDFFSSPQIGIKENVGILITAFVFGNIAVLLDSKYFLYLLKKEMKEEINKYKV